MTNEKALLPFSDIAHILPILNKIGIFGGLSDAELAVVFRKLESVSYEADEIIFAAGDAPTHIYIIRSGTIKLIADIHNEPLEIVAFSVGECFGETALIGIQPHSATAIAIEKSELLVLTGESLLSLYHTNKDVFGMLILNIAREACRRLHKTDAVLLHYVQQSNRKHHT